MSPKTLKRISIIAAGAVVLVAVLIMVRGLGLAPDYDFGAGAYYYADIPDFEKHVGDGAYLGRHPAVFGLGRADVPPLDLDRPPEMTGARGCV